MIVILIIAFVYDISKSFKTYAAKILQKVFRSKPHCQSLCQQYLGSLFCGKEHVSSVLRFGHYAVMCSLINSRWYWKTDIVTEHCADWFPSRIILGTDIGKIQHCVRENVLKLLSTSICLPAGKPTIVNYVVFQQPTASHGQHDVVTVRSPSPHHGFEHVWLITRLIGWHR